MFLDLETGDSPVRPIYEMASGLWPRFSHYELREKAGSQFICPGSNAHIEMYDPWLAHNKSALANLDASSANKGQAPPPYVQFLSFWDGLGIDGRDSFMTSTPWAANSVKLSATQGEAVCDWCRRYGLLGLLFHEVKMFRLPYIEHHPKGNIYKSIAFYKDQGRWRADNIDLKPKRQKSQKALTCAHMDWETGRVELEAYRSSSLFTQQDDKFDWSDPYWIEDNYFPFSDNIVKSMTSATWQDVWRSYCEPVEFFLDKAVMLVRALRLLAHRHRRNEYEQGVADLSVLVGEAPLSYGLVDGTVTPKFRSPSLFSAFALMALEEAAAGGHLFQCENEKCRMWFTSKRSNAKFCSPLCNTAQQQRKSRKRKKDAVATSRQRFCGGCGVAIDSKRPQAKFCSITCGNTYRKRQQRAKKAMMKKGDSLS